MSTLSSSVEHLLTLKDPSPAPGPPLDQLRKIFSSTFDDATKRGVYKGWIVLTTSTLLTMNRPSALANFYRFAAKSDGGGPRIAVEDATNIAALIREAALKSTIFVGVPRAMTALAALAEALEHDVKASLRKESLRTITPENVDSTLARGRALLDAIYAPITVPLTATVKSWHPDLMEFVVQAYGTVLAPLPGANEQGNLSQALGSVVGIACLRAERGRGSHLRSHISGLVKARVLEGLSDEDIWLTSDEGAEWVLTTVDTIYDASRV